MQVVAGGAQGVLTEPDAQDRYRRLVDQSGVGLFETSVDGRVLWVNAAAARIVGYDTPEEFIAAVGNIRDLYVHPERRDEFVRLSAGHGGVAEFEYEIWHKTGAIRWISVSSRAVSQAGEVVGFEGTVIDITDRKLVEAATAAIGSGLMPEEAITEFAQVLQRVVPFRQLTLGVIEDESYRRVVSVAGGGARPLTTGEVLPLAGNSVEWVVETGEHLVVQDTSEERWPFDRDLAAAGIGSYAIFPLIADSTVFATFNLGMSDPDAFSDEIVRLLALQVGAAAQAVRNILIFERERSAVERLEALDDFKDDLIGRVAHDLKTPLALISGFTSLLREKVNEWSPEERAQAIDSIARNVDRISRRVTQDLNVALIESGEIVYDLRPLDVGAAIRRAIDDATILGKSHDIEVEVGEDVPLALGDTERNQQVLDNLIGNAMKFAPADTPISVGAHLVGDYVELWVADEGPGIPVEDRPRLFKKMGRLQAGGEGTGLGLYICKALVEGQGGTMSVGRALSGGARFAYTLPVAQNAQARPGSASPSRAIRD
ncbi:MAG: ATP-binding protein [Actinomycetota bacterium]